MKKRIALLSIFILAAAAVAFAAGDAKPELRPSQKLMQGRKAGVASMQENLAAKRFTAVAKAADTLAAETKKSGEKHPNPLGKELTLAISSLATEISAAAAKQDESRIKARLEDIGKKCGQCHAEIRDKKK